MSFTVTQRKRGGFEYTSVAETQAAALVLAQMMRRAGDEYCTESAVTVQSSSGAVVTAWRGGTYGWQPVPQARPAAESAPLQPLQPARAAGPPRRPSSRFARLPTDPMQSQSQVSMSRGSYASVSITDYTAGSIA